MKRTFLTTGDGSTTIHIPEWDEQYHSKHGAIAEAQHVFIKEGLHYWLAKNESSSVSILEIGFGTGLNTFLTLLEAEKKQVKILYTGIEAYPLGIDIIEKLNYASLLDVSEEDFLKLHNNHWEEMETISQNFQLLKQKKLFSEIENKNEYNLIYFDAFGIRVQPELWTEVIFKGMYDALRAGGTLVTYAANGNARRALQAVGFEVSRISGPPGKKEMMRAVKN